MSDVCSQSVVECYSVSSSLPDGKMCLQCVCGVCSVSAVFEVCLQCASVVSLHWCKNECVNVSQCLRSDVECNDVPAIWCLRL